MGSEATRVTIQESCLIIDKPSGQKMEIIFPAQNDPHKTTSPRDNIPPKARQRATSPCSPSTTSTANKTLEFSPSLSSNSYSDQISELRSCIERLQSTNDTKHEEIKNQYQSLNSRQLSFETRVEKRNEELEKSVHNSVQTASQQMMELLKAAMMQQLAEEDSDPLVENSSPPVEIQGHKEKIKKKKGK